MATEDDLFRRRTSVSLKNAERRDLCHIGLSETELLEFRRAPSARFLIRERTPEDILLPSWASETPPSWIGRGARPLVVVFRSGFQLRVDESPGFLVLARAIQEARCELTYCPALGADALPDASPCFFLFESWDIATTARLADWPVPPVISNFTYIDAPGDWSMGHYGVYLYKQFDARTLSMIDRYTLGAFQAMIDRQRGFDRKRLRSYTGPLVYPLKLLLASRRRRI